MPINMMLLRLSGCFTGTSLTTTLSMGTSFTTTFVTTLVFESLFRQALSKVLSFSAQSLQEFPHEASAFAFVHIKTAVIKNSFFIFPFLFARTIIVKIVFIVVFTCGFF